MNSTQKPINENSTDEASTLRAILESAVDGIVVIDEQGIVKAFNSAAEEVFGLTAPQIIGRSVNLLLPPPYDKEHNGHIARYLETGQSSIIGISREVVAQHSDGSVLPMDLSVSKVVCSDGSRLFVGVVRDITERKQAEKQLRNNEARMRAILDTALDGIITINESGIIEVFNQAAELIFGYAAEEIIGQNVTMLMPQPYREEHDNYLSHYLSTGEKKIIGIGREVVGLRRDGTRLPLDLAVSEVEAEGHRLFTGVVRDISDRKRSEGALRNAQERLLQSERLSAIGEAMTGLTHESRNALQRSQACLEMLKMVVEGNAEANDLIDAVQRAQDDLHRLYEKVREYAAPLTINRSRHDVGEIVQEAWMYLSHRRNGRIVRFFDDHSDLDLNCDVDEFALRQVFQNIFDNALTACVDPVEVTVSYSECNAPSGPALQVSVRDNGPGLSPEVRRRAFEPFFTTKTHGTGLGMAICQRFVQAHGGEISVGDGDRQGAEFVVTLPRRQE